MVAVVTESAANVPPDVALRLGITVVPLVLHIGGRSYRDGVDMSGPAFYERLTAGDHVSTAAPSVGDFLNGMERAGSDEVVCVTLAGGLSASNHQASLAAERFGGHAVVVDSGSATMGEGFVAIEAARAALGNAGIDGVVARAREVAEAVHVVGTVETFDYLKRSGRVSRLQAYAATALNIHPVFRMDGGEIAAVGRPRTRGRALTAVIDEVVTGSEGRPLHIAAFHALAEDAAHELARRIAEQADVVESHVVDSTPVIGANTGPGLVGVAAFS